jgi:thymidylate synthase
MARDIHSSLFLNNHYHYLLKDILNAPEELNQRTNTKVKALPNRVLRYEIDDCIPMINSRRMFPASAMAELIWTLSGTKDLTWLQQHTKMWDGFANEENEIEASYGYRWREQFGRDQIQELINALVADPSDRQCFVSAWDNAKDGLGNRWTTNVPCPTSFTINIIDYHVNINVNLRSSDAIVGLPYDTLMYTLLLIVITNQLNTQGMNLSYGSVMLNLAHVHIYEPHYEMAHELIDNYEHWLDHRKNDFCYDVQDLSFNIQPINWAFLTIENATNNPDAMLSMFKRMLAERDSKRPNGNKWPVCFKPEVIK